MSPSEWNWIIIYYNKERRAVVIDNCYDCMFSVIFEVETIGM